MLLLIRLSPQRPPRPQRFFWANSLQLIFFSAPVAGCGCPAPHRPRRPAYRWSLLPQEKNSAVSAVSAVNRCFSGFPVTGAWLRRGRRPRVPCQSPYRKSALRFGAFFWPTCSRELRESLMSKGIKKILPKPGFSDSEKVRIFFRKALPPRRSPGGGVARCAADRHVSPKNIAVPVSTEKTL